MKDGFQREISYLRVSVTERCNLNCCYCMGTWPDPADSVGDPAWPCSHGPNRECQGKTGGELSLDRIQEIVESAAACGIRKVRITGGEPLLRRDVARLCGNIGQVPGIDELAMTTNGILLGRYAGALSRAGLSRVNISLDTLDEKKYKDITGSGRLRDVLTGIRAAEDWGLTPIKLNVVLLRGINEDEIRTFAEWTRKKPIEIRFLELMPVGASGLKGMGRYLGGDAVLDRVPELIPLPSQGVASLYRLPGGSGRIGIIRPVSRQFCPSCNRIRLTSDGRLKSCLHSALELDLSRLQGEELRRALEQAILQKPAAHSDFAGGAGSDAARDMNRIGG